MPCIPSVRKFEETDMLDFITKQQYWSNLEDPKVSAQLDRTHRKTICLKHIQDAWILAQIGTTKGQRIIEIGGGFGRVLRTLDESNERWNLDIADGPGRTTGEQKRSMPPEYNMVHALLGEFSQELPESYFNLIFSISVMEHIPVNAMPSFWKDHARIMQSGARAYHAIDFYLGDETLPPNEARLDSYFEGIEQAGLVLIDDAKLQRPAIFRSRYASNPDFVMHEWNSRAPSLAKHRAVRQSVSLGLGLRKP